MIYNRLKTEHDKLIAQLQDLRRKVETLPEGELICVKNGSYTKWFKSNNAKPTYIPKSERSTAEVLALKKFYSLKITDLCKQIKILEQCLKRYDKFESKSSVLLNDSSYQELLAPYLRTFSSPSLQWVNAQYEHNTNHPENLIHSTLSGHKVRSKSEVIIASALFTSKIPYRYECALHLKNVILYPDFTVCHPETTEIFYWEHFGMMDNPSYCDNTFNKLKLYANHGIIPTINLITTFETASQPIDSEKIMQIIQDYFL